MTTHFFCKRCIDLHRDTEEEEEKHLQRGRSLISESNGIGCEVNRLGGERSRENEARLSHEEL